MSKDRHLASEKKAARTCAELARRSAHEAIGEAAAAGLARTGLSFAGPCRGKTVSGFIPFGTEIDTRPLLQRLAADGVQTCLPVVVAPRRRLEFRVWRPGEPTVPGRWDIPVPPETARRVEPDILLVPMLAFDRHGYRLGYGGGFYDMTLHELRKVKPVVAIGVAYSAQQVDAVAREPHDEAVDWVLTERGATEVERT